MSATPEEYDLEQTLRDWSSRQALPSQHTDALARQILEKLDKEDQTQAQLLQLPAELSPPDNLRYWRHALRTVAAALVLWLVWHLAAYDGQASKQLVRKSNGVANRDQPPNSKLPQDSLAQRGKLFAEINRDFDSRLQWIADTNTDMQFDLSDQSLDDSGTLICLRLSVAGERGGVPQRIDLLVRDQQLVQFTQRPGSPMVLLWPYLTSDGKVLVESELRSVDGSSLAQRTVLLSPSNTEFEQPVQEPGQLQVEAIRLISMASLGS